MKPRVAIGITTYQDLSETAIGGAVYDALATVSPRIAPTKGDAGGVRVDIASSQDFLEHWLTSTPYEIHEARRGPLVEMGAFRIGLEWRSTGSVGGRGQVRFHSELDPNSADTLVLDHAWSPGIDWAGLFDKLVEATRPSYAMLHLFTEREIGAYPRGDRFDRFEGPVVDERSFTAWLSSLGEWRYPDAHRLEERRQYRFLPQLSWANVLGKEFDGRYDAEAIERDGFDVSRAEGRVAFRTTKSLVDVERDPEGFNAARDRLREAFAPDTFRR